MRLILLFLFSSTILGNELNDEFFARLAKVESGGNPKAWNKKEDAKGLYQIRPAYFQDAQKINGDLIKYSHSDCFDPVIARKVVETYLNKYSREKNWENYAKCHNGGLFYFKKKGIVQKRLKDYYLLFLKKS